MNNKFENNNFLARWLNNELTPEEFAHFEASDEFVHYKKIRDASSHLSIPKLDKNKVLSAVYKQAKKENPVKRINLNWLYSSAAAVLIMFGVFQVFKSTDSVYKTGFGEQLAIVLPDGSQATLNAKSKLTFNKKDWEETRELTLKGEAYFKVKKGSLFTVNTSQGDVKVLGTEFNINTQHNFLETHCYHGKVSVTNTAKNISILTKGSASRTINNKVENTNFNIKNTFWLQGESRFNQTPLPQVILALEAQYNITIKNKAVFANQNYTGSFVHNNLNTALKTVFKAMEIDYSNQNNKTIVLKD